MHLKSPYSIQSGNVTLLENINHFLKNVINICVVELKEEIKESIPEVIPVYYTETYLKIIT